MSVRDVYIQPGDTLRVNAISGVVTVGKGEAAVRVHTGQTLVYMGESTYEKLKTEAHLAHEESQAGCSLCYERCREHDLGVGRY